MKYHCHQILLIKLMSLLVTAVLAGSPNIIFIITDDMGWGDVGFNGQQRFATPHIDRLASQGVVFDAFYSGSTVCGPSRASLMTGRHQGTCKIRGNPGWNTSGRTIDLDDSDMTIAKELKRAGYVTACFGKWGLNEDLEAGTGHPLGQGFEAFVGYNTHREAHYHWAPYIWRGYAREDWGGDANWKEKRIYSNDVFTDEAVRFIEENALEAPFFLYLAYTITHLGITVPEDSRAPYENLGWPVVSRDSDTHYNNDPNTNTAYAGMVSRLDGYLGRIANVLKRKGIEENTLIFFTSDNGPHYDRQEFFNSNGPYRGYKRNLTEGGIIMPAFAWWSGTIRAGSRIDDPWAFWDILPTLCDLAGVKPSAETDGLSFVPSLLGKPQPTHEYLYWEFNEKEGPMQAIRFGDWKGIRLWDNKANRPGPIQLYDLSTDPGEETNLAKRRPEIAEKAEKFLSMSRSHDPEYPLTKRTNTGSQ